MLVFGVISPHPPIIIPEIGGAETKKVRKTIDALETAAQQLAAAKPNKIVIIAPHRQHGYEVPLYYLSRHLTAQAELEKILVTIPSYQYYYELGKKCGAAIEQSKQRVAIIASADLSHVLKAEGSYGFHPAGPKLDEIIIQAVRDKDAQSLLSLDREFIGDGAECGLRSILYLFGVFAGKDYATEVLSYEGPNGVGYMVAVFTVK